MQSKIVKVFNAYYCSVALLVVLCLLDSCCRQAHAYPMDLYDDVSDFFDAISLDDIPISTRSAPETFCRMPARKGVCRALIPRWSYDVTKKECIEFKFGGCDGNENNFPTYKACMSMCEGM